MKVYKVNAQFVVIFVFLWATATHIKVNISYHNQSTYSFHCSTVKWHLTQFASSETLVDQGIKKLAATRD